MTVLLTKKQAADRVGLHPEYVMALTRQGKFPKPIKYGEHWNSAVRFLESEIENWIAARIAARDIAIRIKGEI